MEKEAQALQPRLDAQKQVCADPGREGALEVSSGMSSTFHSFLCIADDYYAHRSRLYRFWLAVKWTWWSL